MVSSSLTSVGTLTSLTVSGASAHAAGSFSGILSVTNATASTSTSTGALVVTGGIGTGDSIRAVGNIYSNGNIFSNGVNLKTFSVAMGAALA